MTGLLAIETSSEACSLALAVDGTLLSKEFHEPRRLAELLLPAVRELLAEADIALGGLDAIAFGRGPGSFTSLRIGIGVVQGLAWGAEVGVVPVSSLATLALGAARAHHALPGTNVLAAMDARMGEVFQAQFRIAPHGLPELLGKEQVSPPSALERPSGENVIGAGNGFERYPDLQHLSESLSAVYPALWPSATELIDLARYWLKSNQPLAAHLAQPVYVRDHVADKPSDSRE